MGQPGMCVEEGIEVKYLHFLREADLAKIAEDNDLLLEERNEKDTIDDFPKHRWKLYAVLGNKILTKEEAALEENKEASEREANIRRNIKTAGEQIDKLINTRKTRNKNP